jgi:hypothetical protein
MGALVVAVIATLAGATAGAFLAFRAAQPLAERQRERIARLAVTVLGGAAGAQIAAQLYNLVHQLQLDAGLGRIGVGPGLDALASVSAFRGTLLYGGVLIGLAAIVGLIGKRRLGEVRR